MKHRTQIICMSSATLYSRHKTDLESSATNVNQRCARP